MAAVQPVALDSAGSLPYTFAAYLFKHTGQDPDSICSATESEEENLVVGPDGRLADQILLQVPTPRNALVVIHQPLVGVLDVILEIPETGPGANSAILP